MDAKLILIFFLLFSPRSSSGRPISVQHQFNLHQSWMESSPSRISSRNYPWISCFFDQVRTKRPWKTKTWLVTERKRNLQRDDKPYHRISRSWNVFQLLCRGCRLQSGWRKWKDKRNMYINRRSRYFKIHFYPFQTPHRRPGSVANL